MSTRAFLTIGVFGMRWCVDLSALLPEHADLADTLHHLWARAAVDPNGSELPFVVARAGDAIPTDENGIARGCAFRDAIGFPYVLSRALTMASVSVRRGSALMLHAAALAVPSPAGPRGLVFLDCPRHRNTIGCSDFRRCPSSLTITGIRAAMASTAPG